MANKVASKRWIYSNFSVGSSSNECATKTEILGFGLYITNDSSYASNQLVREEDIYLPAWQYSFSVSDWDKNIGEYGGTTSSISISSTKSRLGETESVGWSIDNSTVPSWITWNSSDMTFTVSSNSSTSSRTANIYFEQDESGDRDYARVTQSGHTQVVSYNYIFWTSASGGTTASGSFGQPGSSIQPGIYSYRETIVDGTVTSRDAVSFSYTDIPSWITGDAVSTGYNPPNSPTYYAKMTASENTSVNARSYDVVITQSGSDKEITISVSQPGKANEYTFEIRKSDEEYTGKTSITFDVPASTVGWSGNYAYRSRKNGEQFANVSFSSDVSWIHVEGSTYTVDHNTSDPPRSGTITLTQAESGLKCYIYINQDEWTPTYRFDCVPNIDADYRGQRIDLNVVSEKSMLTWNGGIQWDPVDYTGSTSEGIWLSLYPSDSNPTDLDLSINNLVIVREGSFTLTQAESGNVLTRNVKQSPGTIAMDNKLTITSVTYDTAWLFPPGIIPVEGSEVYLGFIVPNTFTWKTSSGLTINRGTAYAGDKCNVYVRENGRYKLVKTFTLKIGEQTVTI
jgi:hypothetical protein